MLKEGIVIDGGGCLRLELRCAVVLDEVRNWQGAVVGAGAVVTHDVPDGDAWGDRCWVPARVVVCAAVLAGGRRSTCLLLEPNAVKRCNRE